MIEQRLRAVAAFLGVGSADRFPSAHVRRDGGGGALVAYSRLMPYVTLQTARMRLSQLIERACAGEDIVICRGRSPIVRLVPVETRTPPRRRFGAVRGRARTTRAFFEPPSEEELEHWG